MLKYLFEKYKSMKIEYLNRSPRGKWLFVLNMSIFALNAIGCASFVAGFKVSWYTLSTLVLFIDLFLSFLYTLWYYADQPLKGILSISMFGIFIPV